MAFSDRLNRLFETVYPPGRRPHSSAEVVAALNAKGISMSAPYLSQLRSGKRDRPSVATIEALAGFFGVDAAYFTDEKFAERLDEELNALAQLRSAGPADGGVYTGRHRVEPPPAERNTAEVPQPIPSSEPVRQTTASRDSELGSSDLGKTAPLDSSSPAKLVPPQNPEAQTMDVRPAPSTPLDREYQELGRRESVVDRGRRLFKYLSEVQSLKIPRITNLQTYVNDGMVMWLEEIPKHDQVFLEYRDGESGSPTAVLRLNRITIQDSPAPPLNIKQWLDGSSSDPRHPPAIKSAIRTGEHAADGSEVIDYLSNHPDVQSSFDGWRAKWDQWAEQMLRDQPVIDLYQRLFSSYLRLSDHPEEYELVVAVGCLVWQTADGPAVKRHLLTCQAQIDFNDSTAALTVELRPQLENIKLEVDMLDPSQIHTPDHINSVREDARNAENHLLDKEASGELLKRIVFSLDAAGHFTLGGNPPECGPTPEVAFAPAIIERKRSRLGLKEIFDKIVQEINEKSAIPSGLLPLVDPDFEPRTGSSSSDGALLQIDDEVLSPLPLNPEQLNILRAVDARAQTVVQGPPGTGKTHTVAALLAHLLAQGKRVLVTAQTDQALKEVRAKLPEPIKPLAVAVIGSAQSDMADLKVAVEGISAQSADHQPDRSQSEIQRCLDSIDRLRRERAAIRTQIVDARKSEVDESEIAGYTGSLATIAQRCSNDANLFNWIVELIPAEISTDFPLGAEGIANWLALLRDQVLRVNEVESGQRLIALEDIPNPSEFAEMVDSEILASNEAARFDDYKAHASFASVVELPSADRSDLQQQMSELAVRAAELENRHEQWIALALADIRSGRGATWKARADKIRSMVGEVIPLVEKLPPSTEVLVSDGSDHGVVESMARHLRETLATSGPLKTGIDGMPKVGPLSNRVVKNSRPLFEAVRVNRHPPTTIEDLDTLLVYLDAEQRLSALDRAWPAEVTVNVEDTHWERLQWHATELQLLSGVLEFAEDLQRVEKYVAALGLTPPDWVDTKAIRAYAGLVDAAHAVENQRSSTAPLRDLESRLDSLCAWEDSTSESARLRNAVADRDRSEYAGAYSRMELLHSVKVRVQHRDTLTGTLNSAAPELVTAVLGDPHDSIWDLRLPTVPSAWNWARAEQWIRTRDFIDVNQLQSLINEVDAQLQEQISRLAALRAWDHAVSPARLTGRSRADLIQYAQLVRRLGKGTGKYAAQRRAEIRQAMIRCRESVPVWIMPLYRIADQLDITQDMFDVVVVDEASQAGLEAAFLQYLAPKIVVVGDDKQVSPAAVGVDQQQLRTLANMYLRDDPHRASWEDPKQSFFDEAVKRFGSRLTLLEHRRCVPEIIGFSNRIAYEPENIRLQAVRQYGSDRLDPIRTVRVPDGYQKGSVNKTNPPEVSAIADQVVQCLADPRYAGKTMGIISLQGPAQARAIETSLMSRVDPKEWSQRELRCGDAASFQGSERDVIFLSMVAAREEGTRLGSSVGTMYVQRYNVATSRAKDQLWLFHSIDIQDVPNHEDMRHQLLDYCQNVSARWRTGVDSAHLTPVSEDIRVDPFDSLFEQRVYNRLIDRGLNVVPQYPASGYNIDLVIIGGNYRLAVECDGDAWHGPSEYERDLGRQRDLERCGWKFFRIRESEFYIDPHAVLGRLWETIAEMDAFGADSKTVTDESVKDSALSSSDGDESPSVDQVAAIEALIPMEVISQAALTAHGGLFHASEPEELPARKVGEDGQADVEEQVSHPAHPQYEQDRTRLTHQIFEADRGENSYDRGVVERSDDFASNLNAGASAVRSDEPLLYVEAPNTPLGSRAELDHPEWEDVRTRIRSAIDEITNIEGPIELSRLTRTIVRRFGFDRAKAQRQEVVRQLVPAELIYRDEFGTFVWPYEIDRSVWRGFRKTPEGFFRPLDEIPAEEIVNALAHVAGDGAADIETLMRETLAIFDQRRLTQQATDRLKACIDRAVSSGRLLRVGAGYINAGA